MKKRTMSVNKSHWILVGPTACGKTRWATEVFQNSNVTILSLDSCQVYRTLSIGSAKASLEEQSKLPHALIDCVNVDEHHDVGRHLLLAEQAREELHASKRLGLFLGGSMLYADRLMHGLCDVPSIDPSILEQLNQECAEHGLAKLWEELQAHDPGSQIHPNDRQRTLRALAVLRQTGQALRTFWTHHKASYEIHLAMILPDRRQDLLENVKLRTAQMLQQGLIEETSFWFHGEAEPPHAALRSLGYRQVWSYLRGEIPDLSALEQTIIQATMQYIKHQMTWMKRWISKAETVVPNVEHPALKHWATRFRQQAP